MATPTVYVICDQNCKFESMTKEQILAAIVQAVENGEIKDVDTGFVQTIKTINGSPLRFFVGEQADYDALSETDKKNLFAIITNDTEKESLEKSFEELAKTVKGFEDGYCKKFDRPSEGTTLPLRGYYLVNAIRGGINYCFGVLYWDGAGFVYGQTVRDLIVCITNDGKVTIFDVSGEEAADVTSLYTLYISKIQEV